MINAIFLPWPTYVWPRPILHYVRTPLAVRPMGTLSDKKSKLKHTKCLNLSKDKNSFHDTSFVILNNAFPKISSMPRFYQQLISNASNRADLLFLKCEHFYFTNIQICSNKFTSKWIFLELPEYNIDNFSKHHVKAMQLSEKGFYLFLCQDLWLIKMLLHS